MNWIVQSANASRMCNTVIAPTGYYRRADGKIIRDYTPSPEMGPIQRAYRFRSHRAAARVANTLASPIIRYYNVRG